MKRAFFTVATLLLALEASALADLVTASRATVRVTHQEGRTQGIGSGVIVGSDTEAYYALTNAHVAPVAAVAVEFFRDGKPAATCRGKTIARDVAADVAVVKIDKAQLGRYVPSIIPIDPAYTLTTGDTLGTIGHPHGEGPTAYICQYLSSDELGIHFQPPPKQGRSGSALFDRDFTRVIGLVYAVTTDGSSVGLAVPASAFGRAVGRSLAFQTLPQPPFRIQKDRAIQTIQLYDKSDKESKEGNKPAPAILKTSAVTSVLETSETGETQPVQTVKAGPEVQETQCPGGRCPNLPQLLPKLPKAEPSGGGDILPDTPIPFETTPAPQAQEAAPAPQSGALTEQTALRIVQQLSELEKRLRALEEAAGKELPQAQPEEGNWYPGKRVVEGAADDVQKRLEESANSMMAKMVELLFTIAACFFVVVLIVAFLYIVNKMVKDKEGSNKEGK